MRLLFVTNFYPPLEKGGWEQWCQEVGDALAERGHVVQVLTSRYRAAEVGDERNVLRRLHLETNTFNYSPLDILRNHARRTRENEAILREVVAAFAPDCIVVWGMWELNPQLARLAEELMSGHVAYYMCGYWPIEQDPHTYYWRRVAPSRAVNALKRITRPFALKHLLRDRTGSPHFEHTACVSQAVLDNLRDGGLPLPDGRVIYGGILLDEFTPDVAVSEDRPIQLLYAGSLTTHKGVDSLLQAVALLVERRRTNFHLTIAGSGAEPYVARLEQFVQANRLGNFVTFAGWIDQGEMADFMRRFDVLVFPSLWAEPLARMTMQGLASGLAMVSTTTGGSAEFLRDGENSLTFEAGSAEQLADKLALLLETPSEVARLAVSGRLLAEWAFDFGRMVDEIEMFITSILKPSLQPAQKEQKNPLNQRGV